MNLAAIFRSQWRICSYFQNTVARNITNWESAPQYWNTFGKSNGANKQLSGITRPLYSSNLTLVPDSFNLVPSCGMKVKGIPKLRCKDCYYVRKDGRLFVYCDSHPRHKQMQMLIKKKKTWLLSHACMSVHRPY